MKRFRIALAAVVLALGVLACATQGQQARQLNLYPSPTAAVTQTPIIIEVQSSPEVVVIEVTVTSTPVGKLCVNAAVAVHLRPSPSDQNYPVMVIPDETELMDLGGRSDKWMFVQVGDKQGWVHGDYVQSCD